MDVSRARRLGDMGGFCKVAVLILCCGVAVPAGAFEELPAVARSVLLLKTLAYNHALKPHAPGGLGILLLRSKTHVDGAAECAAMQTALDATAARVTVAGANVKTSILDYTNPAELERQVVARGVSVVYVCVGLEGQLPEVRSVTRKNAVLSVAGSPGCSQGVAVGLLRNGPHPVIVVHLKVAQSESADLDAALLRVALVEP